MEDKKRGGKKGILNYINNLIGDNCSAIFCLNDCSNNA